MESRQTTGQTTGSIWNGVLQENVDEISWAEKINKEVLKELKSKKNFIKNSLK